MGKPGLSLFTARRKSQGNVLDDVEANTSPDTAAANNADSGGFRLLSRTEVEKANERRKTLEKPSKFPRFSGFGSAATKGRNQSFEDDSPGSSKRDSKSSSGTAFSSTRPYTNGQHGSTSTLPSSTDTSSDDNLFANVPRPAIPQHNSSPGSYPVGGMRKQLPSLPSLPRTSSGVSYKDQLASASTRNRAMTASSYASTAVAPKLDASLNFDDSSFEDDMFSHITRKDSPDAPREKESVGRSLLSEKRTFQAPPIRIRSQFDVEPPLKSWDSRGSTDNLMAASPRSDNESPPPPPPPHKFSTYAPVASESPTLQSQPTFPDADAQFVHKSYTENKPYRESSPDIHPVSMSSSSVNSYDTPMSSRSGTATSITTNTTPKAALAPKPVYNDSEDEDLFSASKAVPKPIEVRKQSTSPAVQQRPPPNPTASNGSRVMSQAQFREMQMRQASQREEDSDDEDYEDEDDAIKKREEEEILRRKNQQMHFAREAMRRSTTAPSLSTMADGARDSMGSGNGFPSETSLKADEWEDEDVPLGILAQHGFPNQARNRVPSHPTNAIPSHFPDRPASAGALSTNRASHANLPAFARNLPADPYAASFVGGGLVQPTNRESMGFNGFARGPVSIAGESMAGGMPLMYHDAGASQPSLVDQIQMRDMTKQKYMGGASAKKQPGGPFTGILGSQMNASGLPQNPMRVPQMPMNGMSPMGGMMGMGMGMGMNSMGYPMAQPNDYMQQMQQFQQMQQMIAMQQMQLQQMQTMQPNLHQDPRMSMAMPSPGFQGNMMGNGSFLSVPGMQSGQPNQQNRPMSFVNGPPSQHQPPMSTFMGPGAGYTPSIAPSERSNIGLSARYRPVVNHSDSMSNGTSMTLQATSGAQNKPGVIKGILKKGSPQIHIRESDAEDEDWGSMAARKSQIAKGKENNGSGLEELTRGLNI
ncbi:hypothetical protein ACN47E_005067 [Coniothyrium glycines]